MCDSAFCIDITRHLNVLNTNLQEANRIINKVFDKIRAFDRKLWLWELQLRWNCTTQFAVPTKEKPTDAINPAA